MAEAEVGAGEEGENQDDADDDVEGHAVVFRVEFLVDGFVFGLGGFARGGGVAAGAFFERTVGKGFVVGGVGGIAGTGVGRRVGRVVRGVDLGDLDRGAEAARWSGIRWRGGAGWGGGGAWAIGVARIGGVRVGGLGARIGRLRAWTGGLGAAWVRRFSGGARSGAGVGAWGAGVGRGGGGTGEADGFGEVFEVGGVGAFVDGIGGDGLAWLDGEIGVFPLPTIWEIGS